MDTIRNSYGQNSVASYAVRARKAANVAAPLDWEDLKNKDIDAQYYRIDNLIQSLERRSDPWRDFFRRAVSLQASQRMLGDMLKSKID